ncbi:MAG: hemerythrin domain-containing protein [Muribaculaceae bacterium]|nr:hemerythrin domain-containing protein [Muribaculaceae bacterium]
MATLISDDYRLLQVLSRFGIPLGFGDKTVKEVCKDRNVDCLTFLTVINFVTKDSEEKPSASGLSLTSLLEYLKQSHVYFLKFCLPAIRKKLIEGITLKDSDVSFLILKLFDEYVDGIREHMEEEEANLFPIVVSISNGDIVGKDRIYVYSRHHEEVGSKLKELKKIIIKYCPLAANANTLNDALFDIYRCEEELSSHCKIEDLLLLPALRNAINHIS